MEWMLVFSMLACQDEGGKKSIDTAFVEDTGEREPEDTAVENESVQKFAVLEDVGTHIQLAVHNLSDWGTGDLITEVSSNSILRNKHGSIWLFQREVDARIVRYDPTDFRTPMAEHILEGEEVWPNDITLCGEYAFASLYDGSELLVLHPEDLREAGRISLGQYADDDGYPEASTLVCKKGFVYVSLHRFNRNEEEGGPWPQQLGSLWVVFDPETWEEVQTFPEQGFRSEIFDVRDTAYLGSVIAPHIDVSGTTGFWIFDPITEWYTSQIYFAYNDKTIFDTGIGTDKSVHLATNYMDDMTWMFCHDYTPEQDQPGYAYEQLVPNSHAFVSFTMNEEDDGWLAFQTLGENPVFSLMSIDTDRCVSNEDEQQVAHRIIDWEVLPNP